MVSYSSLCIYWKWPKNLHNLQVVLVMSSCFLVQLCLGSVSSFGNLVPYLVSFIRVCSHPRNLRMTDVVYLYVFQICVYCIGLIIGGALVKKLGPRTTTLIGGVFLVAGLALSYFAIMHSYYVMFVTYGLFYGLGLGLGDIAPIVCAMDWLPKRKGAAVAIVTSGYGFGPLLFSVIDTAFINPKNDKPNHSPYMNFPDEKYFTQPEVLNRVPKVFLVLSATCAVMIAVALIVLIKPPSDNDQKMPSDTIINNQSEKNESIMLRSLNNSMKTNNSLNTQHESDLNEITPLKMLTKKSFHLLWVKYMIGCSIGAFYITLYKSFGIELITRNDYFLTIIGSVSAVFSVLGRLALGLLADATDIHFALAFQAALMSCFTLTCYATSLGGEIMYLIWMCAIFFCIGSYFSLYPMVISKLYGSENTSMNFPILNLSCVVGHIITGLADFTVSNPPSWMAWSIICDWWYELFGFCFDNCVIIHFVSIAMLLCLYNTPFNFTAR